MPTPLGNGTLWLTVHSQRSYQGIASIPHLLHDRRVAPLHIFIEAERVDVTGIKNMKVSAQETIQHPGVGTTGRGVMQHTTRAQPRSLKSSPYL